MQLILIYTACAKPLKPSKVVKQLAPYQLTNWLYGVNTVFNSVSVISRRPVHLSMLSWVLFTSSRHKILFNPQAAFPHKHCQNNGERWEMNDSCRNDYHQSSERILAEPGIEPATSCSQVRNDNDWAIGLGFWEKEKLLGTRQILIFNSSKRQILDSSKLKGFADDNFQFVRNVKKVLQMGRKHCGKRRNCLLRAIFPFPTILSKDL